MKVVLRSRFLDRNGALAGIVVWEAGFEVMVLVTEKGAVCVGVGAGLDFGRLG